MKVLQINAVPYGSTCSIMLGIARLGNGQGLPVFTASGYSTHPVAAIPENHFYLGGMADKAAHLILARITGLEGYFSTGQTRRLLRYVDAEQFDLIHFHNLHGSFLNFPLLMRELKKRNIPLVWTFHDCWPLTGQCPHFTMAGCSKWKTGCGNCGQNRRFSWFFDQSKKKHRQKQKLLTGLDMTIVTPSRWLANLVGQSYLREYPTRVINNGIDLSVFRPCGRDFRERKGIRGKYLVLGVSFGWDERKGLDVFVELSRRLGSDYQVVLVGTDDGVDKQLPPEILSIHRTQDQRELAQIYSAADVFVNPTREENYPTVNMEALACGTPVVTFQTGGSPEMLDETCGAVVKTNDIAAMEAAVRRVCREGALDRADCRSKAKAFSMHDRFQEYIDLYKEIYERTSKNGT